MVTVRTRGCARLRLGRGLVATCDPAAVCEAMPDQAALRRGVPARRCAQKPRGGARAPGWLLALATRSRRQSTRGRRGRRTRPSSPASRKLSPPSRKLCRAEEPDLETMRSRSHHSRRCASGGGGACHGHQTGRRTCRLLGPASAPHPTISASIGATASSDHGYVAGDRLMRKRVAPDDHHQHHREVHEHSDAER
jgi:hypothetical protein